MSSIPITLTMQGIPPKEEKFCKDCSHLLGNREWIENWETWKCSKTKAVSGINLVTGQQVWSAAFCDNTRKGAEFCGPEGKWYEEYVKPNFLEPEKPSTSSRKRITESDLANL